MKLSGWLLPLEMTASKGSPELRNSEYRSYFICVYTCTRCVFVPIWLGSFWAFFTNAEAAWHWAAKISHLKLCPELCLLLNPHLPAQSFGAGGMKLMCMSRAGDPQAGCWRSQQFHHGAVPTLLTAPLIPSYWLWCGPQLHPALLWQGQELAGTAVELFSDRTALSSQSSCPVEPGSIWGLRG